MSELKLPEDTEEMAGFAEFSSHWMTLQRDKDGVVYLVSWFHQIPTVLAVVRPGGSVVAMDNY